MTDITLEGITTAAQEAGLELAGFAASGFKDITRFHACFRTEGDTDLDVVAQLFREHGFWVTSIKYRVEQNYTDTSEIHILIIKE